MNIFLSEGAGVDEIVAEMEAARRGARRATRSATCKLDTVNPGAWFAKQFAKLLGAEKTLVQKSGYFARSAAANDDDLRADPEHASTSRSTAALRGESGVIGHDEERGDELRGIEFPRIKGGKAFDTEHPVVHRAARRHRAGLTVAQPWSMPGGSWSACTPPCSSGSGCGGPAGGCRRSGPMPTTGGR